MFAYAKEMPGWFAKEILLANNFPIQFGVLNLDNGWFRKPQEEDHDYGQVIQAQMSTNRHEKPWPKKLPGNFAKNAFHNLDVAASLHQAGKTKTPQPRSGTPSPQTKTPP